MPRTVSTLLFTLALATPVGAVDGLAPKPVEPKRVANTDVGIDDKVGEQVPLGLEFANENGDTVTLGDCIAGKPTILVLAYYRCPMNCTDVLNGLVDAMRTMPADFSVGGAFNVVTVSFDAKEQPGLAAEKKTAYLRDYGRPGVDAGWHFLTGKRNAPVRWREETIKQLTDAVGFRFVYDRVYKEYDHPTGVVVLTPGGKISRYFYGQKYDGEYKVPGGTTTLRLSLVEASEGKVGSLLDRLILRCFRFDHIEKKYSLNILMAIRVGGVLTVLSLVTAVAYFTVRGRRQPAATPPAAGVAGEDDVNSGTADRPAGGLS